MLTHDILIPFGIGLATLLFGLKAMEIGLHEWAGPFLSGFMRSFTHTPLRGLLTGIVTTTLLQSSSAVTVITIGLVNAGVLTFRQTLGIVLGTNIGACLTVDTFGLDLSSHSLLILLLAACVWFLAILLSQTLRNIRLSRSVRPKALQTVLSIRCLSLTLCGFACILIGMERMYEIVPTLQSRGLFVWFLEQSQRSLLWGLVVGAVITALIQSSTIIIAVTMGLAAVHAISVDLGIAITLGANIGTCSTALLACIGGTRAAHYVAWSHILLNLGGSLLFFAWIDELALLASLWHDAPDDQIADAQTLFNVLCSAIALPFCYIGINNLRTRRPR